MRRLKLIVKLPRIVMGVCFLIIMVELKINLPIIPEFDDASASQARLRQDTLTKPPRSLGRLESLSIQLAGIYGRAKFTVANKTVIIMAADHGVTEEGVSAFPASVTSQMVLNFLRGGAAINVLARQAGAKVVVVDMGVAADFDRSDGLLHAKIAHATHNMAKGPAMTREQAEQGIQTGFRILESEIGAGLDLVALGEMGIGNSTAASAITAVITGQPVNEVTGRGTGLDDKSLQHKIEVIRRAIEVNHPDPRDALDVLIKLGGFEIAGLAGVALSAASHRIPVVLDGFISSSAALLAYKLNPAVKPFLLASHLSVEKGHRAILEYIGLEPLLNLDLRLGEGTGAVLVFNLIEAAAHILNEMSTFEEAGVDNKE
jgi:nicotinate-nucleotide--dimethylbenzimidazole phosphoribosyltransferase